LRLRIGRSQIHAQSFEEQAHGGDAVRFIEQPGTEVGGLAIKMKRHHQEPNGNPNGQDHFDQCEAPAPFVGH
jgi:hypothetical protein